jgi:hypothetical protein
MGQQGLGPFTVKEVYGDMVGKTEQGTLIIEIIQGWEDPKQLGFYQFLCKDQPGGLVLLEAQDSPPGPLGFERWEMLFGDSEKYQVVVVDGLVRSAIPIREDRS